MPNYGGPERRYTDPGDLTTSVQKADQVLKVLATTIAIMVAIALILVSGVALYNFNAVKEHRERNERLHTDQCRLLFDIIAAVPSLREQGFRPCSPQEELG